MHSTKRYRARLARGLRMLRRQYKNSLKSKDKTAAVYREWLRDNHYLIEREGKAALRELRRSRPAREALFPVLALCRGLCAQDGPLEGEALAASLLRARCKSAGVALAPLALRLALIESAVNSAKDADVKSIGGAVTGLRALPDMDFAAVLEQVSPLERCLRRDPAGVYPRMEESSRAVYRHLLALRAKKKKRSEEEEAQSLLDRAAGASGPDRHVGTALFRQAHHPRRGAALLACESLLPILLAGALASLLQAWPLLPLLCLPLTALCRVLLEALFLRGTQSIPLPRVELGGVVPGEGRTLITVSTLLPCADLGQTNADFGRRLEELYASNGGPNVSVCMLADLKAADCAELPGDDADLKSARAETERLCAKYNGGFLLAVRHRSYSPTMGNYAGRERKRGAIGDLAGAIHTGNTGPFRLLCGDLTHLRDYKYLLALDADTRLPLDTVPEMVAAALHPSNRPQFDLAMGRVVRGYGIISPHVELDLDSSRKTPFAHAMAGEGGSSPYSTQTSERYQDVFGCGIFAGKGLIDIAAFALLKSTRPFPAEQVLSHDILEGGYLRTGFLADVHVADGFPARQESYFTRQERWVRGDWQNLSFLRKKKGLPPLSRYQLFDNLRRSLIAPGCLLAILASLFAPPEHSWILLLAGVLGVCGGHLVSALRCLGSGGLAMLSRDYYAGGLPAALGDLTRAVLQVVVLAQEAWTNTCAILRALWRCVTHKKQLEWTTAAQGEKAKKLWRAMLALWPSLLAGGVLLVFGGAGHRALGIVILANLLFAPLSGRKSKQDTPKLTQEEQSRVHGYCNSMWNYFETYCTADQHFLPPDNVQEVPVFRVAARTSPTNLGLYLLCILAARDLGLIDTPGMLVRLDRTLSSVERLEKWRGSLLNWYDTRTLCPLEPKYVSTVDTGNFLVSIRTLRKGLEEYANKPVGAAFLPPGEKKAPPAEDNTDGKNASPTGLLSIINRLRLLEEGCDLRALYHPRRKLFHIGLDLSTNKPSGSYYDLLMSEARMTSYYAIAARAVPKKHWGALGRTLARRGRFTGPVSWTGTMFEYFMPYLFLPAPRGTLGYEALRFCLSCQKDQAKENRPWGRLPLWPWGQSESGFYAFDPCLNYQYKAHGVQKLGLRRGLGGELVSAPYASFLAMQLAPKSALQNLRRFERMEMLGSCGFYEAADATPARVNGQDYAVVRSFMAHHVGMSMLAALNTLQDGILRRRFMADEEMASAQGLLLERIPDRAAVFRDIDLRDTPRPRERVSSARQVYARADPASPRTHLLSNGEWSCVVVDCGAGASFYRGVSIYKHSPDLLRRPCGVLAALRGPDDPPVSVTPAPHYNAEKCRIEFASTEALHCAEGNGITALMRTRVHPRLPAEQRQFILKNTGKLSAKGSLWVYFEPSLTPLREEAGHPAFTQLFLTDQYDAEREIALFTRRKGVSEGETLCLAAGWGKGVSAICERSREKALRRGLPFGGAVLEGNSPGNGMACAAYEIAYRLQPGETKEYSLFLCAGMTAREASARLQQLRNEPQPVKRWAACPFREGELPSALAQRVLPRLLFYAPLSPAQVQAREKLRCARQCLWPLGLSGEEPYIYVEVRDQGSGVRGTGDAGDISSVLPWLSLFRRLRAAGLPCELAIGYREGGDYDSPVSAALREALRRERCAHLENGGVRLVNLRRAEHSALEALEAYAAHIGGRDEEAPREQTTPLLPILSCKGGIHAARAGIQAGQGTFLPGKFVIEKNSFPPPVPWSLPLCNPAFGTLVSDSSLGFTWAVNARENKLSPWHSDPCADNRGEMLLLKFGSRVFDLLAGARCEFSPEMARWSGEVHGIEYAVTCQIPARGLCKRVEIILKNTTDRTLTPALAYYLEPVLGVRREPQLPIQGEVLPDGMLLHSPDAAVQGFSALMVTGGAEFQCASRGEFLKGNWAAGGAYPQADPCAAIGRRLQLQPGGESLAEFVLTWGACKNAALTAHLVAEFPPSSPPIPNPCQDEILTTWLPHQVIAGRLWGRTGHAQCGGAWGFRDQLQDVLALVESHPALVRRQIARCAAAQFPEGDALHWWHRLPGREGVRGVRTRYADDYLWLPFVCSEYVLQSKDYAFLDTKVPFRQGEPLGPDEAERYAVYYLGHEGVPLYEHCLCSIERALTLLGAHGLPLMLGGDWNDGMNRVGANGAGESVWLGMFLIMCLERTAKLCEIKHDFPLAEKYRAHAQELRGAIDEHCWAGDRYLRAFWDDGAPLGGCDSSPCGIDLLPQCFACLCDMPDPTRINTALDTAMAHLVDEEHGIVRLLREPFTHRDRRAGYINDYPPGVRENGGQYTHAAIWLCMALFKQGRENQARRVLAMLNPAQFCRDERRMAIYRAEPYFLAGDVSGAPGGEGRAGWTIYTGSAAWMMKVLERYYGGK